LLLFQSIDTYFQKEAVLKAPCFISSPTKEKIRSLSAGDCQASQILNIYEFMLGSLSPRSGANLYLFNAISSFWGQAFLKENQLFRNRLDT